MSKDNDYNGENEVKRTETHTQTHPHIQTHYINHYEN